MGEPTTERILRLARPIPKACLAAQLLALVAAAPALADWDGGGTNDNWSTAANWNPDGVPANNGTATVTFSGSTRLTPNADASWDVLGVVFGGTAGAFTLGGSPLTIRGSGVVNNSTNAQTIANDVVLGTGQTWNVASGSLTATGVMSGGLSFTKSGPGLLTLTGANTFTSVLSVAVNGGPLRIQNGSALGGTGGSSYTLINSGGAVQLLGDITVPEPFQLLGDGVASDGALRNISGNNAITGTVYLWTSSTIGADAGTLTLGGVISQDTANLGLTKVGAGTVVLSGANTYTGAVAVNAGVLRVQSNTGLGTTAGGVTVASGAALQVQGGIAVGAEALKLNGSGVAGDGALRNVSGNNSWSGALTLNSAAAIASDSGTLALSGTLANGGFLATFLGAGDVTLSGVMSGSGGLTKSGTGTLTLSGSSANTFSGALTVDAGTLLLSKTAGQNAFAGTLTIGDGVGGTGADVVRLGAANQIPTVAVAINDSGLLDLNGNSDAIGTLSMTGGSVTTGAGTLTLGGDVTGSAAASTASISGNLALGGNRIFTIASGTASPDMSISAVVSGANSLTKSGTGVLVLSGANTHSAGTTVSGGTLMVNNATGSGTGTGAVTVNAGATLGGTGTASGAVTVNGAISPGASPGTLNTGAETWNGGGSYLWEVNQANGAKGADPGWDWLNITGALTISATSGSPFTIKVKSLNLADGAGQATNFNSLTSYTWTIATASGGISGFAANKFTIDTSAFQNATSGGTFSVSQAGNNLNLVFTPAPLSISGTVFEDVNYGGGAGRDRASSSGVVRSGARVELYDGTGAYVTSTTTDGSGSYSFTGLAAGSFTVRVVDATVTSSRTGYVAGLLPVLTFRTNASSGTAVAVADYVGGQSPAVADAGNASGGSVMNTATGVFTAGITGTAQSFTPVTFVSGSVAGVDFGFNFDAVVNTNDAGRGSLRQFLTNANTLGGDAGLGQSGLVAAKENAVFMISNGTAAAGLRAANNYFSGGIATINLASGLPSISTAMALDAQKQPGWSSAPIVELNGSGVNAPGLYLTGGGITIRGFIVNRFTAAAAVYVSTAGSNTVQGNYVGTNSAGTAAAANYEGVHIANVSGDTIGGTGTSQGNVISGNNGYGISTDGSGTVIQGNYIGTNAAGTGAVGNTASGVYATAGASNVTVGGTAAGAGNVISGNNGYGLLLSSNGHAVQGNKVGTNAAGSGAIANGWSGIYVSGANNTIGGSSAGAANLVAYNTQSGIVLDTSAASGNLISRNSIYGNGALGIDLGANGVTGNDGVKTANQPNLYMDFPVLASAGLSGTSLTVAGYVGSAPNQATFAGARVEVFKSDNDLGGFGEGQTYLGALTADASGNFTGTLDVSGKGLVVGNKITGTATDGANNTSEFGANTPIAAPFYQPDAMIKLASEGAGAYLADNVYEAVAATQVKSQGVVNGSPATYSLLFQNDGNLGDNLVVTQAATVNCTGFTVGYRDGSGSDVTAAVTGSGATISGLAPGASAAWTLQVTPGGSTPGGSTACSVSVAATSASDAAKKDQVKALTSSSSANLSLAKSAAPTSAAPGQEVTYTITASNSAGLTPASSVVVTDLVPLFTGLKVGSAVFSPGTSTLSGTTAYSNDNGSTWTYSPTSGGCSASAGYDNCVTNVRWTTTGSMPAGTSFTVSFVVRVK